MSIAPPSDIIMDVAQAADPTRRQAAVNKLAQMAAQGGTPPVDFEAALNTATPNARGVAPDASLRLNPLAGLAHTSGVKPSTGSVYQKFEAVLLQNFVENILPKNSDLFGDAASADSMRSMFAEKIAEQMAKSGRIGIAKTIEQHAAHLAQPKPKEG